MESKFYQDNDPELQRFLSYAAEGNQDQVEKMLINSKDPTRLLLGVDTFKDKSGRLVKATAFDYLYWAKDWHMCEMLKKYMDKPTMAQVLKHMNDIDTTGLFIQQQGKTEPSTSFDISPLIKALKTYEALYKDICLGKSEDWEPLRQAWMEVGKAQRELPVHVVQEYCCPGRPFAPTPQFDEATLPRDSVEKDWYSPELGKEHAFIRGFSKGGVVAAKDWDAQTSPAGRGQPPAYYDARALNHLFVVRSEQFKNMRKEFLSLISTPSKTPGLGSGED